MHAVLRRRATSPRRRFRALILGLGVALLLAPASGRAQYVNVAADLDQWTWARTEAEAAPPITAVAVRADGWLVVATNRNQRLARQFRVEGGELHAVPPWGAVLGPGTRLGPATPGFTSMVMRKGRLYGLTSLPTEFHDVGQKATLLELDPTTGGVLRDLGTWWWPALAVDPRTDDLVLYDFVCERVCGEESTDPGAVTHPLVRFDPDSGRREVLVPDTSTADVGGSSTCGPASSSLRRCEEIYRVAFSPDGEWLFMGTARTGRNFVDIRDRGGAMRAQVEVPAPADALVHGQPGTCLEDTLVLTVADGTVFGIVGPVGPSPRTTVLAAGGRPGVSGATLDGEGHVVTPRRSHAQLLACAPFVPPTPPPPEDPPAEAPDVDETIEAATAPPPEPPPGSNPSSPAPPPGQAGAPPPAGPPPPSPVPAGPPAHAPSVMTSTVGALADSPEDQPMFSLTASRRTVPGTAWTAVGLGAAALAAATLLVLESHPTRGRVAPVPAPARRRAPTERLHR